MPTFLVTVVDLLGVFVPGLVMLIAVLLVPAALGLQPRLNLLPGLLGSSLWVLVGLYGVAAYILGFLVRLKSIDIMNALTLRRWTKRIGEEAEALEPALTDALANRPLTESLKKLAEYTTKYYRTKYGPGKYAPYFHYAKRLLRRDPRMWAEVERLEAEARFTAGLFVPLVMLFLDGILLSQWGRIEGWWRTTGGHAVLQLTYWEQVIVGRGLMVAAGIGVATVYMAFPERRRREVLYVQLLALAALAKPPANIDDEGR
jgi:hypothetical protein